VAKPPRVAIDFRWLDDLCLCNGQYRYAVDLIRGLAELDADLQFVVLGSKPEPVAEIADVFAGREQWQYRPLPRTTGRRSLYREHWNYFRMLEGLGSSTSRSPNHGAPFDLLHVLHSFVPVSPPIPVIETVYDMMPELFPEYAATIQSRDYRIHKWAFTQFATRAIAISQTTANDLHRLWNFRRDRIDVVYLGPKLPAANGTVTRSEVPIILSPYNLEPRKNLSRLLKAVAKLRCAGVQCKLVLFGHAAVNEEREREFQDAIARLRLESCVELTGRISDEELTGLYRRSSVFVFPSLYEGFGLPVLEAMSCGARVIAHDASAMAEVVGDAGYLVDMNDPAAIANAIRRAMNDAEIGDRARLRAQQFSRERMARETLEVYRNVLSRF